MLASVTHDLRTPLNSIIGLLESSQQEENIDKLKEMNDIILKNSILLINLINDILDYSLIIKAKIRIVPTFFHLKEMIYDIIALFKI